MAFDAENIFSSWRETKKVQFRFILITVKFSQCCHALFANQVYYSSSRSFQISCRSRNVRLVISGTSFLSYMFPCNPQLKTFRMQCKVKSHSNWCITCFPRLLNLNGIRKECRKTFAKSEVYYRLQWLKYSCKHRENENLLPLLVKSSEMDK